MQLTIGRLFFDAKVRVLHIIGSGSFEDYRKEYNRAALAVINSTEKKYSFPQNEEIENYTASIQLEADWDNYDQMLEICIENRRKLQSFIEKKTRPNVIICWGWKRSTNTTSVVRCLCEGIYGETVRQMYEVLSVEGDTYGIIRGYGVLNWWGPWQRSFNAESVIDDLGGYFDKKDKKYSLRFYRSLNRWSSIKSVLVFLVIQYCLWYIPASSNKPQTIRLMIVCYYFIALFLPYYRNKPPKRFFRTLKGKLGKAISLIGGICFGSISILLLLYPEHISVNSVTVMILIPLIHGAFSIFKCKQQSTILHSTAFFDAATIFIQFFINIIRPVKIGDFIPSFGQQLDIRLSSVEHHSRIDSVFFWDKKSESNAKEEEDETNNSSRSDGVTKKDMDKKSFYLSVLGVDESASKDSITKAYHELMKKYHPDLHANASEKELDENEKKAKLINEAYEYLIESRK